MARTICVYMKCDPRTRACSWVILHVYTYAHMARTICVYMKCDPRTWSSEHSHIRQSYQVLFRWESNFTHELTHICHKRYVYTCNATHELDHPSPRTHVNHTTHFLVVTWIPLTKRGGGLGSRPKKMYGERLGDGVEYHLMKPTPRR